MADSAKARANPYPLTGDSPAAAWRKLSAALVLPQPSVYFSRALESGTLQVWLPELARLSGVPQKREYHPEVDTFVHVMLALDFARRHFDDPLVTFAVLLHDLGKGLTPEQEWPSHRRHEHRGVAPVQRVCARFEAPADYRRLAERACEHHLRCHRLLEMRPIKVLRLLEAVDGLADETGLTRFTQACEADKRGRAGLAGERYPQGELLRRAGAAARAVTPCEEEQAQQLAQRRAAAISEVLRAGT